MGEVNNTPFDAIYDSFWGRVTDDMYFEWNEADTQKQLQPLLLNSLYSFEFPRFDLSDYEVGSLVEKTSDNPNEPSTFEWVGGSFHSALTQEEISIMSLNMAVEWFMQQLATTENTRQNVTSSDWKQTSQANHMAKLKNMIELYQQKSFHLQRLYKRRKIVDGRMKSTASMIMTTPSYGAGISARGEYNDI